MSNTQPAEDASGKLVSAETLSDAEQLVGILDVLDMLYAQDVFESTRKPGVAENLEEDEDPDNYEDPLEVYILSDPLSSFKAVVYRSDIGTSTTPRTQHSIHCTAYSSNNRGRDQILNSTITITTNPYVGSVEDWEEVDNLKLQESPPEKILHTNVTATAALLSYKHLKVVGPYGGYRSFLLSSSAVTAVFTDIYRLHMNSGETNFDIQLPTSFRGKFPPNINVNVDSTQNHIVLKLTNVGFSNAQHLIYIDGPKPYVLCEADDLNSVVFASNGVVIVRE